MLIDDLAAAFLCGVIEAQARDDVPAIGRLPVELRVHAEEIALVLQLSGLVDFDRTRVRPVRAVRKHAVFEVVAVLLAVAVQPVEAVGPGQFVRRVRGNVGIEVRIRDVDALVETVGIVRLAVFGEVLAQEAADVVALAVIDRKRRGPVAETEVVVESRR
jgi:hypothetical protein